ncbi:MAG: butyrate kinase [Peptostreptococcaceae bacterium]|nr:butyrate kinase [Peptostreptococcaceae bacterium]
MLLLVINPGGTSTKVSIFDREQELLKKNITHSYEELKEFERVMDQLEYRKALILDFVKSEGYKVSDFEAIVGRGGLMKPIPGGVYRVNDAMINDLKNRINGEHASNLGACLAFEIAEQIGKPAFIVDPVSVDEFLDVSRITGIKDIVKASWLHALNHKAVCRLVAEKIGSSYQNSNFIVAHLGSGISIVAHQNGKMIDGSGGRSDGPFSPERSGGLPTYDLINLCFSGKYTYDEMVDKVSNSGGMYSYLKTKDMKVIEERALSGDKEYRLILDAFCYKVAKEIASYTASLEGKVNGVIITGGIAYSNYVVEYLKKKIGWIAEFFVVPGEMEMEALAKGAVRVLSEQEQESVYQ